MWYFSLINGDKVWYLKGDDCEWTIGRGSASFSLANDRSVSRNHAKLKLCDNGDLILTDNSSRYGTFVEFCPDNANPTFSEKLGANDERKLKHMDAVRFGLLENQWIVRNVQMTTCFSTMKPSESLSNTLNKLNVKVFENWTDKVTFLTMPSITLTLKVVLALVDLRLIVTPQYWEDCLKSYENDAILPEASNYSPNVMESTLNQNINFAINPNRQKLFKDKQLIFFSNSQMLKYQAIIEKAQGKALLLSSCKMTKLELCAPKNIVIQFMPEELSQDSQSRIKVLSEIVEYMKRKNLRVIPEAEIGLAILYISLQKYCNPQFSFAAEIIKSPSKNDVSNKNILAPESQIQTPIMRNNVEVDETTANSTIESLTSPETSTLTISNSNRKTKRNLDSSIEEPPKKKNATEDDMFNFIEPNVVERTPNVSNVLNIKKKINLKRHQQQQHNIDEDLFNFVPETDSNKRVQKKKFNDNDNLDINIKRFCSSSRNSCIDSNSSISSTDSTKKILPIHKTSFENSTWMSCKDPPPTIKCEKKEELDSSLEDKLKELDLRQAVIVINNNLIKKDVSNATIQNVSNQSFLNFKKFSKVRPLKPQIEVIKRNELQVYYGSNKSNDINCGVDSDEENNMQFQILEKHVRGKSNKTRRL